MAAGCDGLLIEVHNDPAHALSDGPQSLNPEAFDKLNRKLLALHAFLRERRGERQMNVGIVGLGLIGGSMAKSIKTRTAHTVWGVDLDAETMTLARLSGAIDGTHWITRIYPPAI